jgi:sugar transferase (PEP-CTERM/EpsH1 system associated)
MRNLLFLSHRIPYPPDKGEKIRAWHIFRHLARSHRMHLGCFIDDSHDLGYVPILRDLCTDTACVRLDRRRQKLQALTRMRPGRPLTLDYFHDVGLQRWVDATLSAGQIDRIFVSCSAMAPYVMGSKLPRILDMVDIDSQKWAEYGARSRLPTRLVWAREGRTLLAFERQAALSFDCSLFVSEAECRHFAALAPESRDRIDWLDNGVDLQRFSPALAFDAPYTPDVPALVFTGTMNYWPNGDAVAWFAREVMPLLRHRSPAPAFYIVGANPGPEILCLAALPGVHVTGRVADVRPYIAHAAICVAPLRVARGIQNKVLEGMAMGRPVIASSQAFEGIRAEPGRDLLIADGAAATAGLVTEVLDGRHPGLGAAARRAVERGYSWSMTLQKLDTLFIEGKTPVNVEL